MKYRIIYADPPWPEKSSAPHTARPKFERQVMAAVRDFPLMSTDEICALGVPDLADENCALFLWCTSRHIPDALRVIEAWGFRFVKIVFTWMKVDKAGRPVKSIGYYTKSNSEFVLLGIKGKMPPANYSVGEAVLEPRSKVFRKPRTVRERIEVLYGNMPRVELFAREAALGWDVWGNQIISTTAVPDRAKLPKDFWNTED